MELVTLLDENGTPSGTAPKQSVHTTDTPLHLAFSCYLFNEDGLVLLTRRALTKATWPGVWTNSFCGHPAPGEAMQDAIIRRGRQELGVPVYDIRPVLPEFRYRATDASGIVENEVCPVFIARTDAVAAPEPSEVAEWAWAEPASTQLSVDRTPFAFSPWMHEQLAQFSLQAPEPAVRS